MLPDLLQDRLEVVFCGTAAGGRSALFRLYYAGHGNKFWRILHAVGLTPRVLNPSEFQLLLLYGVGLTDIVKDQFGMDRAIRFHKAGLEILRRKIQKFAPRFLCFNVKEAAKVFFHRRRVTYGLQDDSIGPTQFVVAPSTSQSANRYWETGRWQDLADLIRKETVKSSTHR